MTEQDNKTKRIFLDEEDRQALVKLYDEAEHTPVIKFDVLGPSLADTMWNLVRKRLEELGEKYGFDPRQMKGVNKESGEVAL